MTPELERYYENRLTMFTSQGWKDLIEDVTDMLDATNRIEGVTLETLPFKQGELSMMNWLLRLETTSKQAYMDLAQENENSDVSVGMPSGASDGTHNDLRDENAE